MPESKGSVPNGTTHIRKNIKKGTTVFFKEVGTNQYEVNNKGRWERYKDHTGGIIPVAEFFKQSKNPKGTRTAIIPELKSVAYEPQVSTFKESVFERIPEPVLRDLVKLYETHDVVEIELHVKMTSVIKG